MKSLFIFLSLFSATAMAEIKFIKSAGNQSLYSLKESIDVTEEIQSRKTAVQLCMDLVNDPKNVLGRLEETCVSENKIFSNAGITACVYRESQLELGLNFICMERPEEYKNMDCNSYALCKYNAEMAAYNAQAQRISDRSRVQDPQEEEPKLTKREEACRDVGFSKRYDSDELDKCLQTKIDTDLIIACTKVMKKPESYSAIKIVNCYTSKQSIEKITLCGQIGFFFADQVESCYKAPASVEVIKACKESGIKGSNTMEKCIKLNKPVSKIRDCSIELHDPYDNNDSKIEKCLNKWY